jgi:ELWxxDGT repeat protein
MKKSFFVISIIAAIAVSLIATKIVNAYSEYPVAINGIYYFSADDRVHGSELWASDGTAAGTVMVKDITPGGSSFPVFLTNVNGKLFFETTSISSGTQIWTSDGTAAGTVMVKDTSVMTASMTKEGNNPFYANLAPAQDQLNLISDQSQNQNSPQPLEDVLTADKADLQDCLTMASDWLRCDITYLE